MARIPSFRFLSRFLPLLTLSILLFGCDLWTGGSVEPSFDGSFTYISGSTPSNGESAVDAYAPITVVFSAPLDNTPITPAKITVRDEQGNDIPVTVTQSGGPNPTATFQPHDPLLFSTRYSVAIGGLRDAAGKPVFTPGFSFTTGAEPLGVGGPFVIGRYGKLFMRDTAPDIIADESGNYAVAYKSSSPELDASLPVGYCVRQVSRTARGGLWGPNRFYPTDDLHTVIQAPRLTAMPADNQQTVLLMEYDRIYDGVAPPRLAYRHVTDNGITLDNGTLARWNHGNWDEPLSVAHSRNGRQAAFVGTNWWEGDNNYTSTYSFTARVLGPSGWNAFPPFTALTKQYTGTSIAVNASGRALLLHENPDTEDLDAVLFDPAAGQWTGAGTGITDNTSSGLSGNAYYDVALGDDGTGAAIWTANTMEWGRYKLKYRLFSVTGGWSSDVGLFLPVDNGACVDPRIAAGPGGTFIATCWVSEGAGFTPYGARYAPGAGWSSWTPLTTGLTHYDFAPLRIAVDGQGTGYVAWIVHEAIGRDLRTHVRAAAWRNGTGWVDLGAVSPFADYYVDYPFSLAATNVGALVSWSPGGALWAAFLR